jgi:hypothetical protein
MAERPRTHQRTGEAPTFRRAVRGRTLVVLLATLGLVAVTGGPAPHPTAAADVVASEGASAREPVDLRTSPLPQDEPELAAAVFSCELPAEDLCPLFVDLALQLEFAWQRAGYQIRLLDGAQAPSSNGTHRVTGRARADRREIELYVHWTDTVIDPVGAFAGVHRTLAHELGHVMHQSCGNETLTRWREVRSIPSDVPDRGHGHDGIAFNSVAEDFAEVAMAWLTNGEFRARSPFEGAPQQRPYPGADPTVSAALAAEFFVVCR